MPRTTMLVYSHLRWDFVYQRPQHVMSRMAKSRRVLFIEEPVGEADSDGWERIDKEPNLTVYRPRLRGPVHGFEPAVHDRLAGLLESLGAIEGIGRHTAWLYTPLAYPPARTLAPEVIVYDCMDELANFRFAPREIVELESRLLRHADLVLCGGPSLYRAKKDRHPNVHCFPSSVDVAHFRRGRAGQPVADDYKGAPRPRLGFFGVIDERIDFDLLGALAEAHPEWSIWMVGPVVKVEPEELPQAPNLHYTGGRPYAELPRHLAAWDVALLPFALNDATRFISPTKTLEYMAAEHPIVSTPIRDVAGPYEDVVRLGESPEEFVRACEEALASSEADRADRAQRMRAILARTSWDHTVKRMEEQVDLVEGRFVHYGRTLEVAIGSLLRARNA
jgi:UDP-galactopyranose mutase